MKKLAARTQHPPDPKDQRHDNLHLALFKYKLMTRRSYNMRIGHSVPFVTFDKGNQKMINSTLDLYQLNGSF
ncbi:hypothetical protein FLACHUCJ7_01975 [Flavobacterium chungangense]|uniref:Uncharacterized protein n=1 Tax=Flavobacterium chungangense TaxID=554283 RepID=A0A6V6YZ76_9FLAO|nr:hypothetical protein FLACHUCJ7_01975 [Flavobacterium chungangense]